MEIKYLFSLVFLWLLTSTEGFTDNTQRKFKDGFIFGVSSAAFQVEGAWNVDGKGESIWDRFLHSQSDRNGDDAADSYTLYKRDVEMIRELGADFYRFSVSWARVMPTGFTNNINEKGLQYYDRLINELVKYNIIPIITLYHWDMPQALQDLGGWANPLIAEWFLDYSKILMDRYRDRVKYWITINQPNTVCFDGYGSNLFAPGINSRGLADYLCVKNVLLAHAKVYRMYEKEYKMKYKGEVGISISMNWIEPINNKTENVQAAQLFRDYLWGLYVNPIWSTTGDFPKSIKEVVAKKSRKEGFIKSRLPILTDEEIKIIKGSSDFLGLNHYTSHLAAKGASDFDIDVMLTQKKTWPPSQSPWLRSVPYGLYRVLIYLNQVYDYPPIIITENGVSTDRGLRDPDRIKYLQGYLNALLLAIEDGSNVMGYTAWSLLDNVEWAAGTSERFGLYEVDFDSKNKKRTARMSALFYKNLIRTRTVADEFEPKSLTIKVSNRRLKMKNEEL